jgi:hypothetical protein
MLAVTPGGQLLVTYDCRDNICRLRAYELPDGAAQFDVEAPNGDVVGITDEALVIGHEPCEPSCIVTAISLDDGTASDIGSFCGRATIVQVAAGPALVTDARPDRTCSDGSTLAVVDLRTGVTTSSVNLPEGYELVATSLGDGLELPPGSVMLAPDGNPFAPIPGRPAQLISLQSGTRAIVTLDVPRDS